uniref:disks large-associated protein 2 n=1 Tax=Panthera onca TaxID=9690 RepID=UPI002952B981|nr:disks large-associated protein 2 [Panthera onca]
MPACSSLLSGSRLTAESSLVSLYPSGPGDGLLGGWPCASPERVPEAIADRMRGSGTAPSQCVQRPLKGLHAPPHSRTAGEVLPVGTRREAPAGKHVLCAGGQDRGDKGTGPTRLGGDRSGGLGGRKWQESRRLKGSPYRERGQGVWGQGGESAGDFAGIPAVVPAASTTSPRRDVRGTETSRQYGRECSASCVDNASYTKRSDPQSSPRVGAVSTSSSKQGKREPSVRRGTLNLKDLGSQAAGRCAFVTRELPIFRYPPGGRCCCPVCGRLMFAEIQCKLLEAGLPGEKCSRSCLSIPTRDVRGRPPIHVSVMTDVGHPVAARPVLSARSEGGTEHVPEDDQSYLQAARDVSAAHSLDPSAKYNSPKFRSRNQSYMRAVSTLSQASCVSQMSEAEMNGQFESVCESVFSEVESQAMDALDLPGCFRTRSHSYLRAIQAGYSQDDECIPVMTPSNTTPTVRSTAAVSYANYKKTPPPVPPRTTSKPLISVTAQSSTESTQDAYQDSRAQRASPWPQDGRGLYNSTDSLDSNKAMSLALETAAAQRLAAEGQSGSTRTSDKAVLVSKVEDFLKSRRSSIGIQDSEFPEHQPYPRSDVETATDSDTESRGLREYHSVGVQVEDEKRHGRFKRSNSVTAAVQADLELEGFPGRVTMEDKGLQFGPAFQRHSEPSTPTQYGAVRTVRTQGVFSYREDYRAPVDTATLPPPEPWLEPCVETADTGRMSPCRRDGSWFVKLLHTETKRMEGWCKDMEREAEENDLSEEILGKIRSAVGSAQLLMSQKFQQFYWLCQQNMDPSAMPRPTSQDLAGYWDMLQLSVEDVSMKFDELHQLKLKDWKIIESPERKEERKVPPPIPKKPPRGKFPVTREKSLDLPDRQRQEARRRLMAAKRAASFRQNSASERADSIEIYIPEAQTRL